MQKPDFTAWIKAASPRLRFEDQGKCVVAWRLASADRAQKHITHLSPLNDLPPRPELRAIVAHACEIARRVPEGSNLLYVTDLFSFWGAFHPAHKWIEAWRAEGFAKRPPAAREEWKTLDQVITERGLTVESRGPESPQDHVHIRERKKRIADFACSAAQPPKEKRDLFAWLKTKGKK